MNRPLAVLPTLVPAALAGFACHTLPGTASLAPNDSTVCYALRSGPWTSWIPHAFAAAPAGMQMPLPDTIGLAHAVSTISYGRPLYAVLTLPADSDHAGGIWIPRAPDSVDVRFPARYGWVLRLRLATSGEQARGLAWVAPDEPSDLLMSTPSTKLSGDRVSCPAALVSSRAGA